MHPYKKLELLKIDFDKDPHSEKWSSFEGTWYERNAIGSLLTNYASTHALSSAEIHKMTSTAEHQLRIALEEADDANYHLVRYNLATTLNEKTRAAENRKEPRWAEDEADFRTEARSLFFNAANDVSSPVEMRCTAWSNLATNLMDSKRFHEAADAHKRALLLDPTFGPSAFFLSDILNKYGADNWDKQYSLELDRIALKQAEQIQEIVSLNVSSNSVRSIEQLISFPNYEDFVFDKDTREEWIHHNGLNFTLGILGGIDKNTDPLLPGHIIGSADQAKLRFYVGLLNDLKSDYIAARDLCFKAFFNDHSDAKLYNATSAEERYGSSIAELKLSLVGAIDAVNSCSLIWVHLNGLKPTRADDIIKIWTEGNNSSKKLRAKHAMRLNEATGSLMIPVREVAFDLAPGGYLHHLIKLRNAAAHRDLRVYHPTYVRKEVNDGIDRCSYHDLHLATIEALKLCKAVIISTMFAVRAFIDTDKI